MGMTIAEKILAKKSGRDRVAAGDLVTVKVDTVVLFDNNFMPSIWQDMLKMEHPERVVVILDHRVPAVRLHIPPERGNLVHPVLPVQHADRAKLNADGHGSAEEATHLRRRGRGRQIPIEVSRPQQGIAHSSANAPGVEARLLKRTGDLNDRSGDLQAIRRGDAPYPQSTLPPFTFTISPVI